MEVLTREAKRNEQEDMNAWRFSHEGGWWVKGAWDRRGEGLVFYKKDQRIHRRGEGLVFYKKDQTIQLGIKHRISLVKIKKLVSFPIL